VELNRLEVKLSGIGREQFLKTFSISVEKFESGEVWVRLSKK